MITRPDVRAIRARLSLAPEGAVFDDTEISDLAEPVRRHLRAAIAPGTPLARAARLRMRGSIKLRNHWLRFRGREVLAPHEGFVWSARVAGLITGSDHRVDGHGALDWRLLGLLRVAHDEGSDVARSGAGRAAGEAVWLPTALLPRFGVDWQATDDLHLSARFRSGDVDVELHMEVDEQARVRSARFDRWGDPGGTGTPEWHPFVMTATAHATFGGVTVPSAGRAGWGHASGDEEHGEFFRYELTAVELVTNGGSGTLT